MCKVEDLQANATLLAGIKQSDVDDAPVFMQAFDEFVEWVKKNDVAGKRSIFVTCGNWDLDTMVPAQCRLSGIEVPDFLKSWINLKEEFTRLTGVTIHKRQNDMLQMMKHFEIDLQGELHNARDDVINCSKVLRRVVRTAQDSGRDIKATKNHDAFEGRVMPPIVWSKTKDPSLTLDPRIEVLKKLSHSLNAWYMYRDEKSSKGVLERGAATVPSSEKASKQSRQTAVLSHYCCR